MNSTFNRVTIISLFLTLIFSPRINTYAANPPDEGMWLPLLIERLNYVDMQKMGLHLTADELYNINHSSVKDAIVGLSGGSATGGFFCTAEVVSDQGLLFTNHHCGYDIIQEHSTTDHDYLTNGFWAFSKEKELSNESLSASFLVRMENVTDSILPFLPDSLSESARNEKVKELTSNMKKRAAEDGTYEVSVKPFFGGNEYYLFVFKTYLDVRLVGAPPSSIGKFGGDTDNWIWPRHTGDFSILRIYADSSGIPASYNVKNVPLHTRYHLPVSLKGIKKDDFTMVWGYPGTTSRNLTSAGLEYDLNILFPFLIKIDGKELEIMKKRMDADPAVRIGYSGQYAIIANSWKNYIGQVKMLRRNKVEDLKKGIESDFVEWYSKDPARKAKYGNVLGSIRKSYTSMSKVAVPYLYSSMVTRYMDVVDLAKQTGGLKSALEQKKKSAIKSAAENLKETVGKHFQKIDPGVSENILTELLIMYHQDVKKDELPSVFKTIEKDYKNDFYAYTDAVYKRSIFGSEKLSNEFFNKPRLKILIKDPGYQLMQSLNEAKLKYAGVYNSAKASINTGNRHFIQGLREMNPKLVEYPDANSTMRMSYGKVDDYFPADAVHYDYFTTLKGVMEKEDSTNEEFVVDKKLKELYAVKDFGPYGENGEMHTCFISTNDITGGNSGSPVINADGQLIGLAFDGNWEAMSGDIAFEHNLQRTINVDIRYVLFIIDKFAGAKNIIDELTIVK